MLSLEIMVVLDTASHDFICLLSEHRHNHEF